MLNKTAYLNGLTKQKQLQINMESLRKNLKNMKSINKKSIELDKHDINTNKGKYLERRRIHQIDLENAILAQKMEKIVTSRNQNYYSNQHKYSKSLNGFVKRTTQQKINSENYKFLSRLQLSKPTYQTKKLLKEFEHIQSVQKIMSNSQFYLTDSPTFRNRKVNSLKNRTFMSRASDSENQSFLSSNNQSIIEDVTLNDGRLWQIKITRDQKQVKIIGQMLMGLSQKQQTQTQIRLISIPYLQANSFLKKYCQNKLKKFINYIKVDQKDNSLLLIVPQKSKSPSKILMNPQDKYIGEKKSATKSNQLYSNQNQQNKIKPRQVVQNLNHKIAMAAQFDTFKQQTSEESKKQLKKQELKNKLPSISSRQPSQASKKQTQKKQSKKTINKNMKSQSINEEKSNKSNNIKIEDNIQQINKDQKVESVKQSQSVKKQKIPTEQKIQKSSQKKSQKKQAENKENKQIKSNEAAQNNQQAYEENFQEDKKEQPKVQSVNKQAQNMNKSSEIIAQTKQEIKEAPVSQQKIQNKQQSKEQKALQESLNKVEQVKQQPNNNKEINEQVEQVVENVA